MRAWWRRRSLRVKFAAAHAVSAAALWLGCLLAALASGVWRPEDHRDIFVLLVVGWGAAAVVLVPGGYWIAGRLLMPVKEMAERTRRVSAKDLSRRLAAANPHDELGRLAGGLNEALEQLQEAFAELDRLTADVAHELRTPLTAMRAVGEVALRERNPALLHDAVGSMLEEIRRMNHLIERLLLLTGPGDDEMPVKLEAGPVRTALLEASESLGLVAEEKKQRIEVDCADHLLAVFDPALLRLALVNLVQNAIRYSPPGKPIRLRARTGGGGIVIEVADEGPGIAPEHQQKIFERFYRVDKARSRAEGGVGLGLAIVKWAVERMGGSVELRSEPGRGSVFGLRLRAIQS